MHNAVLCAHGMARRNSYRRAALAGGAHFLHTDYPGGYTSECGFVSGYTQRLVQVLRGSWDAASSQAANTSSWDSTASNSGAGSTDASSGDVATAGVDQASSPAVTTVTDAVLGSVCNPVTGLASCTLWKAGAPSS